MLYKILTILIGLFLGLVTAFAQDRDRGIMDSGLAQIRSEQSQLAQLSDSSIQKLEGVKNKFVTKIDDKSEKYAKRITRKTDRVLKKLMKWESKIQRLVTKLDPTLAKQLFDPPNLTFKEIYEKSQIIEYKSLSLSQTFDRYQDDLKSKVGFIKKLNDENQGVITAQRQLDKAIGLLDSCNYKQAVANQIKDMIQQRKQQLINQSIQLLGKHKMLKHIQKETFYYGEALKNYKALFNNPDNVEKLAGELLKNINGFEQFASSQSGISGLFSTGPGIGAGSNSISNALPSRSSLQQQLATQIPSLENLNPQQLIIGSIQSAKASLDDMRDKAQNALQGMKNELISFKPNRQKALTFKQRLEYGFDVQFKRGTNYYPGVTDLSARIGYKINDATSAGLGLAVKIGLGKGWDQIQLSGEGLGLRAYYRWKRKNGWFIQGNIENDYSKTISKISDLNNQLNWKVSGLVGLGKTITAWKKKSNSIQLLYDIFYFKKTPVAQPFVIRIGYDINK